MKNFKLFIENKNSEIPEQLKNLLIDGISLLVYKGKKKNKQTNYKQLIVKDLLTTYGNERLIIDIDLSNKDHIKAEYNNKNIYIKINKKEIMDMSSDKYNMEIFIKRIISEYKKYLKSLRWKIK